MALNISPLSGYKFLTTFSLENTIPLDDPIINWKDGYISNANTASHVYSSAGIYNVTIASCNSVTSSVYLSVYNGNFYTDRIQCQYEGYTVTCEPYPYFIELSSTNQVNTINLYASGSNSLPNYIDKNFWSHLNPYWYFTDEENNVIQNITLTGTPVISEGYTLGYYASAFVYYNDELPGHPIISFTLDKSPDNSRIYSSVTGTVSSAEPDRLYITADTIYDLNNIQWADQDNPYIVSVGNETCNLIHAASGYLTEVKVLQGCNGISEQEYYLPLYDIKLTDDYGFPSGGYKLLTFNYPSSALNYTVDTNNIPCGKNPYEYNTNKDYAYPTSVRLSAHGIFLVDGVEYSLTGISNEFTVSKKEDRFNIHVKNEDISLYDIIKKYSHFNLDDNINLNNYLSAIFVNDGFGEIYTKTQNMNLESDLDYCTINALYDMAKKMDYDIDEYNIGFPKELERIIDIYSIPFNKLIGQRNLSDLSPKELLDSSSVIFQYKPYLIKNNIDDDYELYIHTENTSVLSAIEYLTDKCVYLTDDYTKPIDSFIDYGNSDLSENIIGNGDFFDTNGIVDENIEYILNTVLID